MTNSTEITKKCNVCGTSVNLTELHPNSLEVPTDGTEWSAMHTGCANGEDRQRGTADPNLTEEDFADSRAWIKTY
jgi:hypothetical protein